jgi:hypothetical protein
VEGQILDQFIKNYFVLSNHLFSSSFFTSLETDEADECYNDAEQPNFPAEINLFKAILMHELHSSFSDVGTGRIDFLGPFKLSALRQLEIMIISNISLYGPGQ